VAQRHISPCHGTCGGDVEHTSQAHHIQASAHNFGRQLAAEHPVYLKQCNGGYQQGLALLDYGLEHRPVSACPEKFDPAR